MHVWQFHDPKALWLLAALPAVVAMAWWWRRRRRASLQFPTAAALAASGRGWRTRLTFLPPALQLVALALSIVALARPQLAVADVRRRSSEGIDLVIALDLSESMRAADLAPDRLHVAKAVLTRFLQARHDDRVALVTFAGDAYTQVPLTLDYGVVESVVGELRTGVLADGTAIGDALGVALDRLRGSHAKGRAVVLITDGDNNAGRLAPADAAAVAREMHVPVFPILIGKGGRAPVPVGRDAEGAPVYQEVDMPVNPRLLADIATATGGKFYRATDGAALAAGLNGALDSMPRSTLSDGGHAAQPREAFGGLAGALALLGVEALLRARCSGCPHERRLAYDGAWRAGGLRRAGVAVGRVGRPRRWRRGGAGRVAPAHQSRGMGVAAARHATRRRRRSWPHG